MPLQDLSVGSTASRRSSSGLGSRTSEPTPEKTSWWDNFKSNFTSSGGDDSNMSNPEDPSDRLPVVDFGDDDSSADIYDEPEFTYEPEVYAAITDAGTANVFYTPDDILQEAYDADMAGKGEDKPDPLGNMGVPPATLKDVTDTDEGALSNPDPLYKMAEEISTPTITTTVLDDEGNPVIDVNKITNIKDVRSDSALDDTTDYDAAIEEALNRVYGEDTDPETGQKIKSADDVMSDMASQGLMSRRLEGKDGELRDSFDAMEMDAYLDEFIPEMAELEGMGGDVVLGDMEPTYSFGITQAKANEYGMQPQDYNTMEEFARAFATRYRNEKKEAYPEIFTSDLDKEVERGLQSYLWNRGSFYRNQLRELREGDFNGFIDELKDVVNAADRENPGPSRPMSGLSKRRAAEANLIGRGIEGYTPIAEVETTGTLQNPIFIWRDAQGNELNRFTSSKPLHSMSTFGTIEVPF